MSDMTLHLPSAPSASGATSAVNPSSSSWIDLETASKRSGKSVGHLRRLSGDVWMRDGLARLQQPADGGRSVWMVREDADASLARVKSAEQIGAEFDVRTLTESQRSELLRRERIVRDWIIAREGGIKLGFNVSQVMVQFLSRVEIDGKPISRATLYNWTAQFERSGRSGLVDERWKGASSEPPESDHFFEEVKRLFLDQRRRSKKLCYDHAEMKAAEHGWPVPSFRTTCRMIARIQPRVIQFHRYGEKQYDAKFGQYIERDYSQLASNELWESDDHQFDVWVQNVDGSLVRPWLTAWMDVRSRFYVGWNIGPVPGDSSTIIKVFCEAGEKHGFPQAVHVDNGKAYDNYYVSGETKKQRRLRIARREQIENMTAGVFPLLSVELSHARKFNAKGKVIERSFGTVCGRFSKQWDTYTGNTTQNRPDDLKDKIAAGLAPTMEDFKLAFVDWIDGEYHVRPHTGDGLDGKTPAEVFAANLSQKRILSRSQLDIVRMRQTKPIKVMRHGVTHEKIAYGMRDLGDLIGQHVILKIDDNDRSFVHVYSLDLKFLRVAKCNERTSVRAGTAAVREANKAVANDKKLVRQAHTARMRMHDSPVDRMARIAAENRAKQPTPQPDSMTMIQTPFDGELATIQRMSKCVSTAIGAESLSERFTYHSAAMEDDQ
jgi:transposase InsO family protein